MNKKDFINYIGEEDIGVVSGIYDKFVLAEKVSSEVFTNEFCTPNVWSKVENFAGQYDIKTVSFGGFEEAERRIIGFNPKDKSNYPIKILKIINKSKFNKLLHKDYLGALMSLGVKRNKLGDLVIKEDQCFVSVYKDIVDYIYCNLQVIGRCPCEIIEINDLSEVPTPDFEEKVIITSSYRLDCVVGALCNISRSKSEQYIKSGKVLLDYVETYEKDKVIILNNTLTIRGFGKYKICNVIGKTSSDRIKLHIKKYI